MIKNKNQMIAIFSKNLTHFGCPSLEIHFKYIYSTEKNTWKKYIPILRTVWHTTSQKEVRQSSLTRTNHVCNGRPGIWSWIQPRPYGWQKSYGNSGWCLQKDQLLHFPGFFPQGTLFKKGLDITFPMRHFFDKLGPKKANFIFRRKIHLCILLADERESV